MKLLTKSGDIQYLESTRILLESRGIPAVITGQYTAALIRTGALVDMGIWVYLDNQLGDAKKVLNDPDYRVSQSVNVELFYEDNPELLKADGTKLKAALVDMGLWVAGITLVVFLLVQWPFS